MLIPPSYLQANTRYTEMTSRAIFSQDIPSKDVRDVFSLLDIWHIISKQLRLKTKKSVTRKMFTFHK